MVASASTERAPRKRHYAMWMFTAACPSRCSYCDIDSQKGKKGLSRDEVIRVANELVLAGFEEVLFAGGEPLLSADLPVALRILADAGVPTAVFSGGVPGIVDRAVATLREGRASRVVFSMDSGRVSANDLLRGRKGITEDLVQLASRIANELPDVRRSVNTVVTRFNVDTLPTVWERMSPFGLDSWSLTLAGDFFEGSPGHALLDEGALARFYLRTAPALARRLADSGAELVVLPVPMVFREEGWDTSRWDRATPVMRDALAKDFAHFAGGRHNASFVARFGCPLVGIDVVIGVGGEVHPCSQAPIIQPEFVVGNVRDQSIPEIMEGDALRRFAEGVPHKPCTRCWAPSNVPRPMLDALFARTRTEVSS